MTQEQLTPYAALVLRVSMGVMFIAHGLLKVMVFTIPGTVQYFESIGYPGLLAYVVIAAELGGGALLIAGAFTRVVALALIPIMIGATLQHLPNGWVFSAEGGGWEFPAFWIATLGVQAMLGAGALSLSGALKGALPQPIARFA